MDKTQLADMWKMPWPVLDVLIGGQSSIDLPELRVQNIEEASDFLAAYGFDPEHPAERRRLHGVLVEALTFIERQLVLPKEWRRGIRPPDEILFCTDVRNLLLWASSKGPEDQLRRAWACAVLRVMHTLAHIEGVTTTVDIGVARDQIFDRFRRHIHRDRNGDLWLGNEEIKVALARVEWKDTKSRNSIILKLLHKRDNVADTLYDYLGVRIVTKRLCDVMLVVKCLRKFHMVVYPNAYPSRARNTLVDLKRFRAQIETLREMLMAGSILPEEFDRMVSRLTASAPESLAPSNPHSAQSYRAIQLTGRQLIRVPNSEFAWLEKLRRVLGTQRLSPETAKVLTEMDELVAGWHSVRDSMEVAAFFPFEVQILDAESYKLAASGEANHSRYKLSQVRAARKRVLSEVLELSRQTPL